MSIHMKDIAYVRYQQPDLDKTAQFLADFGLTQTERSSSTLRMRAAHGYQNAYVCHAGIESRFLSTGIVVGSTAEIAAASRWPEALRVDARPRFEGDATVSVRDPDGYEYDLLAAPKPVPPLPVMPPGAFNFGTFKTRCNAMRMTPPRPAQVLRLGHVALKVKDLARSLDWYRSRLGLMVSDLVYEGSRDKIVTAFLRCDLGDAFADHHIIALAQAPEVSIHHASFEVQDLDEVAAGGQWLAQRGYERLWGVGRHLLGGQIFDYWRDPFGNNLEHYTDGDVFNNEAESGLHAQSAETLYQWGPPLPAHFGD